MSAHRLKLNKDKTELIWIGTEKNVQRRLSRGILLILGGDHIAVTDSVRALGVLITSDLSLDKHVSAVSGKCHWQQWTDSPSSSERIHRSLDDETVAALMHASVTTRVDYCNCLLAGTPKTTADWDKLQRVVNAAVPLPVVTKTRKFDRGLTQVRRQDLQWLDVTDRIKYRLFVNVYKCLYNMAPQVLADLCTPVVVSTGTTSSLCWSWTTAYTCTSRFYDNL